MTTQHTEAQHTESGRTPIYGPEFARDPAAAYARMRAEHGDLAPVELSPGVPATLVLGYDAALEILRDPGTFPRCSEVWEEAVGPECPVLPMMMTRPSALFTNGAVHARLRSVIVDSLERVDPVSLRGYVASNADSLIDRFAADGKADLIGQYARALPLLVFNEMFGCPEDIGAKLVRGMSAIFDTVSAEEGNALLMEATAELVAAKRRRPGADVTSWMMAHPAGLDDTEMAHQIILLVGAGTEPEQNLIANGIGLLLSDDRFGGDLSGGSLPVEDALDEILWTDPPMANYGTTFPRQDVDFHGHRLPAHQPVLVSYAAANTDPSRATADRKGNRAHLSYAGGPHNCPAKGHSRLIASVAIEQLLDRLPDVELAVPADRLEWRPGPFHRAMTALPVVFPRPGRTPSETGRLLRRDARPA
ncbi:cytochrome P450 [Actinomadura madurae]|uniref:cytochrome P450 n=1 Tax=Actinomadura madurae TaxID=1993 RepID=UPI0020D23CB1|nr:cytochrome P450 [Actinomadura madurae]MCP9954059.1 cytochrome P450 [Actinomadura madurae]MCP9970804.1 cytochrome P450 [Actinomadura madurae]MCP9983282.1 cytochrome P450 [Actinomadura madurae]MCQ0005159.1 cytochrome P450 [Actinomadura madurae]